MQQRISVSNVWRSILVGIEEAQLKLEELQAYGNENGVGELEQCIVMLRSIWEVVDDHIAQAPEQVTSRNARQ